MATKPRPWPDNALHARDDAAETMQRTIRSMRKIRKAILTDPMSAIGLVVDVLDDNQRSIRYLIETGAVVHEDKR